MLASCLYGDLYFNNLLQRCYYYIIDDNRHIVCFFQLTRDNWGLLFQMLLVLIQTDLAYIELNKYAVRL